MKLLTLENKDKRNYLAYRNRQSYVSTIKGISPKECECIINELIRFITSNLALYTFCWTRCRVDKHFNLCMTSSYLYFRFKYLKIKIFTSITVDVRFLTKYNNLPGKLYINSLDSSYETKRKTKKIYTIEKSSSYLNGLSFFNPQKHLPCTINNSTGGENLR